MLVFVRFVGYVRPRGCSSFMHCNAWAWTHFFVLQYDSDLPICVCVCFHTCVRACARARVCVCACVRVCVCVGVWVCVWWGGGFL